MTAIDQRINKPVPTKTSGGPCYRRKSYGVTVLFVTWLAYSACALGWFILETPSGIQCTNHIN